MIYGSSQGQSALGSLLRKMQEETQTNPARIPTAAAESSPIRQQIQGPLSSPEAVGSEKVVSMKPELTPSQETPNPVSATNAISPTPIGVSAAAAGSPTVVGPNNIQIPSSPSVETGIIPSASAKSVVANTPSVATPNKNVGIGSNAPATSLSTSPLLPSQTKNMFNTSSQSGTLRQGSSSSTPTQKAVAAGASAQASSLFSRLTLGLGSLIPKSTLLKAIESMKYGGKKATQI